MEANPGRCGTQDPRTGKWCALDFLHDGEHVFAVNKTSPPPLGSGHLVHFNTDEPPRVAPGAARRDPKPGPPRNWCTLEYESVAALAETNAEGDARYGLDNWVVGLPASNLLNHALDHIFHLLDGDSSEPHLEHAMWNLGKLRWMAKHKPEMIDLPRVRRALGMGGKE